MADTFQNVRGLSDLDKALKQLPVKLRQRHARGALRMAAKLVAEDVRARIHNVSGDLAASVRVTTRRKGDQMMAAVKAGSKKAFYAHMVERGTKPHELAPKNRKAMLIGGGTALSEGLLIRASAEHPGARKHPFMRPAMDAKRSSAIAAVVSYLRGRLTKAGIDLPEDREGAED